MRYTQQIKSLKTDNLNVILANFRKYNILTVNKISELSNLSIPSAQKYLNILIKHKVLNKGIETKATAGRKASNYYLNNDYCHFIMANIDNTNIQITVNNYSFKVLERINKKIDFDNFQEFIISTLGDLIEKYPNIKHIAIASYGIINNGIIQEWIDRPQLVNLNLEEIIENKFNISCDIQTNVTILAQGIGKHLMPADKNIFIITLGYDGLSVASIVNKKIHYGLNSAAGNIVPEFFHIDTDQGLYSLAALGANILAPDVTIVYSTPNKKELALSTIEKLNTINVRPKKARFIYSDNYMQDIFTGLKIISLKNTRLHF